MKAKYWILITTAIIVTIVVIYFVKKKKTQAALIANAVNKKTNTTFNTSGSKNNTRQNNTTSKTFNTWLKGDMLFAISDNVIATRNDGKIKLTLNKNQYAGEFEKYATAGSNAVWLKRNNDPGFLYVFTTNKLYKK